MRVQWSSCILNLYYLTYITYIIFFLFDNSVKPLQKNFRLSSPTYAQLWQNFHLLPISILFLPFHLQIASSVFWAYCIFSPLFSNIPVAYTLGGTYFMLWKVICYV